MNTERPEGCLRINTDDWGIFLTYFMIIFLTDLDNNENTYVYLNIRRIKQDFRCLFHHDSIIKMFCSTEPSTSHVHADTFFPLKKTMTVTKLGAFDKVLRNVLWRPQWSLLCFFMVSLFSCFDYFRVRLFSKSVHAFL